MKIVLCGGGSGGHITPLLAVASELRKRDKSVKLIYIGEKKGKFAGLASNSNLFDELHYVSAGKLRRYHGESFFRRLLDIKTLLLNFRDLFRILAGIIQSYFLLRRLKANAVFLKGGFVCVPVAIAAHQHRVPYITHDSDALPGLSNRIAARWAQYHATALPAEYYPYPTETIRTVGIPIDERFRSYSKTEQKILKHKYGAGENDRILLITGGSLGARRLNQMVAEVLPDLLSDEADLFVLHQIGAGNDDQVSSIREDNKLNQRILFFHFSEELFHMSAIADVIVTRAGATTMADYGNQAKACIVVPNPYLTGGHQLKNAQIYRDVDAAEVVQEEDALQNPNLLKNTITKLLKDDQRRATLGKNLRSLIPARSASESIADLLEEISP